MELDGYYDSPSLHSDPFHSRSPSESSTTRLATSPTHNNTNNNNNNSYGNEEYDYYQQDPYAPRQGGEKKKKKRVNRHKEDMYSNNGSQPEKRANSYLPYSNHNRDPYDPVEPIYLQEEVDDLPSFNSPNNHNNRNNRGPVGSILQDNIAMDMINEDHNYYASSQHHGDKKEEVMEPLPAIKKKKWWLRLGISGKKLLFGVFGFLAVVVVIAYFVWPRDPTLKFLTAELASKPYYNETTMIATWNVNFTVDNTVNWVPTNINNFAVTVRSSGEAFGTGNSGKLTLKPKRIDEVISIPINIDFTRDPTNPTLKDLLNACVTIKKEDMSAPKQQTLDIAFDIVYYIAGIVWNTNSRVSPQTYFSCPLPDS